MRLRVVILFFALGVSLAINARQKYTIVSYNCENLFDIRHDSLKNDSTFTPEGTRRWSYSRYKRKVNDIGRVILQTGGEGEGWALPDIVGLVEVENDSVMHMLTKRSMLREAGYRYVMTRSEDVRGIDVALMYNSTRMMLLGYDTIRIPRLREFRKTRDILHAALKTAKNDTLHVFVVHSPSRGGGQHNTEPYRMLVTETLMKRLDSLRTKGAKNIIVMGDFNDYSYSKPLVSLTNAGLNEATAGARGLYHPEQVAGTYYFKQEWGSLDHIFITKNIKTEKCFIFDADWLLEEDNNKTLKPRRTFLGDYYKGGVSDHLPLVLNFSIEK